MPTRFEKFSDRARRVIVLGQEEARLLGHNYVDTAHLLLGLVHDPDCAAAKVLERRGHRLGRGIGAWSTGAPAGLAGGGGSN